MAKFDEHIRQAAKNMNFLEGVNHAISDSEDWQVTCCFYTALHVINAHLSKLGLKYRTHKDVDNIINSEKNTVSIYKLPREQYLSYKKLQLLSRRSRYLVHDKNPNLDQICFTYAIHLKKAIYHLDKLLTYFCKMYSIDDFPIVKISCEEISDYSIYAYFDFK